MQPAEVFELKIVLLGIKPEIWRLIRVPKSFNFAELHLAFQATMGWQNCHCYNITIKGTTISDGTQLGVDSMWVNMGLQKKADVKATNAKIADYFVKEGDHGKYVYDFGDDWKHKVTLMKIMKAEDGVKYPMVVAGERACPPEGAICLHLS